MHCSMPSAGLTMSVGKRTRYTVRCCQQGRSVYRTGRPDVQTVRSCITLPLQAERELLHSDAYLQALVQFTVHVQALTKKEHQLLAKESTVPRAQRDVPCGATPDVSTPNELSPGWCSRTASCTHVSTTCDRVCRRLRTQTYCRCCAVPKPCCSRPPGCLSSAVRSAASAL
jgi:hypothetical protein